MNVRRTLERAGRQDAPIADPAFVRDLEVRLAAGAVAAAPVARRRPLLPIAAAVVAAGAMVGLVVGLHTDPAPDRVQTEPNPSVTTSTFVPPSSTTTTVGAAPSVPSTTSSTVRPSLTTVAVAPAPTTTIAPPTTTTPPIVQELHLTCATDPTGPTVTCRWDASTSPRFAAFRLVRRTQDGPEFVVYTGDRTEASERSGIGARLIYTVTALAADGTVQGRSTTNVICC